MESEEEKKYTQKELDEVRKRANHFEDEFLKMYRTAGFQKVVIVLLVLLVGLLLVCCGTIVPGEHGWLVYLGLAVWAAIIIWALKLKGK
jgi:hypothetical protein